jgi:ABC-type branched-subunit amino acid transport system ATPase component/predicted MFS family arabinose efflux permease
VRKLLSKPFENVTGGVAIFPLVVLFFLYFFDEFDTAAFGTLAPEIESAFHLSDSRFATIVILNLSVVLLFAVFVGYYGDRLPRTRLVVGGALIAGAFSFGTGLATATWMLILIRIGNGIGVLVNDPIHRSLLSDYYQPEDRPRVYALHANAVRVGGVFGPMLAGIVGYFFGWRWAFMILIVPIFVMAYIARKLTDPIRGATDDPDAAALAAEERAVTFGRGSRILFNVKTLRRQYLAWLFIGPAALPLAFLSPLYFKRAFGLSPFERGAIGSISAAAAFGGVWLAGRWTAGWLANGLGEPAKRAGWTLVSVGPSLVLLAWAPTLWLAIPIIIVANFIGNMFWPPFLTTQALVSPARVRSMSFSFGSVFLVAGVWALWLIPGVSVISDHSGIRWGIFALAPYWIIGGLVLRSAHRFVESDTQRSLEVLQMTAELRRKRLSASTDSNAILVVRGLDVSYGPVQVLFGVDFDLAEGEIIALLGTNGAGKSTLLKAISGLVPAQSGAIYFDGDDVTGLEPEDSFALGMVQVPGGRGIFPGLTVKENLEVAAWASRRPRAEVNEAVQEVLRTFPSLERRYEQNAGVLSGGEQQMLTLGQAFIAKPKLLMIDELSLGLAPIVVEDLLRIVRRIHDEGTAVILVEQSINIALTVASRALFMEKGEVRFSGATADLMHRDDILRAVFLTGAGALEGTK